MEDFGINLELDLDLDLDLELDLDLDQEIERDLFLHESMCGMLETNLPEHLGYNEIRHCDLFEIQLYINMSVGLMQENSELLNLEIEQMLADLAA